MFYFSYIYIHTYIYISSKNQKEIKTCSFLYICILLIKPVSIWISGLFKWVCVCVQGIDGGWKYTVVLYIVWNIEKRKFYFSCHVLILGYSLVMCFFLALAHTDIMTHNTTHLILTHLITSILFQSLRPIIKEDFTTYSWVQKSETTIENGSILHFEGNFKWIFLKITPVGGDKWPSLWLTHLYNWFVQKHRNKWPTE